MSDTMKELRNVPGLKDAVIAEAAAQARRAAIAFQLEAATVKVMDASKRRNAAIEAAAAGAGFSSISKIEKEFTEASQSVRWHEQALAVAETAVDQAERAVASVMRKVLVAQENEARAERAEMEAQFLDASRRRTEAAEKLEIAARMARATTDALYGVFAAEIAAVS